MYAWIMFAEALVVFLLLILVPGYVIARCIGATRYVSIVSAAPTSCFLYSFFGVILFRCGILGYVPLIGCIAGSLLLCVLSVLCINKLKKRPMREAFLPRHFTNRFPNIKFALLYVVIGIIAVAYLFLCHIGSPVNINQMDDNVSHLTTIADIVRTGNYSTLDSSSYSGIVSENLVINPGSSYYPLGFHILVALMISIGGFSIGVAENAAIYGFVAVLYPLGFSLFMQLIFPQEKDVVKFGAFLTCACVMFPTRCLVVNGFYPFVTGMALIPSALSLGVLSAAAHLSRMKRLRWLVLSFLVFSGIACVHPNGFLAALAILIPFIVIKLVPFALEHGASYKQPSRKRLFIYRGLALIALAIAWIILFKLPFFDAAVNHEWDYHISLLNALFNILSMGLRLEIPAVLFAVLVFIGFIRAACNKRTTWLSASFAFIAALYVITVGTRGLVAHLAGGFWYGDPERLSAMVAITSVPLAAYAFAYIFMLSKKTLISSIPSKELVSKKALSTTLAVCLLGGFSIVNFAPNYEMYGESKITPFGVTYNQTKGFFDSGDNLLYTPEEKAFVRKVQETIPENATVLNLPADGSILANSLDDLNVYYRTYSVKKENYNNADFIRKNVDAVATNHEISSALQDKNIEYIMLLDCNTIEAIENYDEVVYQGFNKFTPSEWIGLLKITDETPGLEIVLSENDMRLYKIVQSPLED